MCQRKHIYFIYIYILYCLLCKTWKGTSTVLAFSVFLLNLVTNLKSTDDNRAHVPGGIICGHSLTY
jgi:hypothetical protein